MKFTLTFVFFLFYSCLVPAQTSSAPEVSASAPTPPTQSIPRPVPSTTTPSDSNLIAHPAWYQACIDRIAAVKGKPVDLIFIGDSITEGWNSAPWGGEDRGPAVWQKFYATRNALNFGVGADATQNVLWRFDHMDVKDFRPKVAVVLIGTNNTRNLPQEIAAGIRAVLDKTREVYPGIKIILVSIMPNRRANGKMAEVNALIQPFADNQSIYYLDLAAAMPLLNDNWKGLGADHLHPNAVGYQIWAETMEPLLTRLLDTH